MEYLLVILGAVGLFLYNVVKRRSAEALLENVDIKNKLNEQDKTAIEKQALKDAEVKKRQQLIDDLEKEKGRKLTNEELAKFFNDL